jgi:phosphate transport system substrate-binding protein
MMDVFNRGDRTRFGTRRRFLTAAGAAATVGLAGCLGGGNEREVRITGSSTVFPLSEAVAEEYQQENDGVNLSVSSDGTTGGFEQFFIPGDSDINGASRPILEEEVERCRENGFEPIEIQCAGDALTAIANNEADWVDCMTMEELGQIWDPDAENELWSDVNSEWPDEPFELYGPATTSGTSTTGPRRSSGSSGGSGTTSRAPNRTTSSPPASRGAGTHTGISPSRTTRTTRTR